MKSPYRKLLLLMVNVSPEKSGSPAMAGCALPAVAVDREKEVKIMRQGGPASNHGAKIGVVLHLL